MAEIDFVAHPGERSVPKGALLCGGCCCCCCCLHTVGGAVGALAAGRDAAHGSADAMGAGAMGAGAMGAAGTPAPAMAPGFGASTVSGLYWKVLGILCVITAVLGVGVYGLAVILMALPLMQLLASGIVAIILYKNESRGFHQLGRLTLFSLLGAIAGIAVMVALVSAK